jgi:D-xylonolactonase
MKSAVDLMVDCKCVLGEGPLWSTALAKLFWADIESRNIWSFCPATNESKVVASLNMKVGGFAFTESQALVLCTDTGVFILDSFQGEPRPLFEINLRPDERFNDITTDPLGRIYAGTLEPGTRNGKLYRLEQNRKPVVILKDIGCSNGMTFSLDETLFYHTDSHLHCITRYHYDRRSGDISKPETFFQGTPEQGYPDGLTIDLDGNLWVAFWGASCVRKFNPKGEIIDEIRMPVKQPTSVMFGGAGLSDLFITSAAIGDGDGLGGPLFRLKTSTKGRPEWLARF